MNVLKIATAGSVDDGKSTLIGRLLYETNSLATDKLAAIEKQSKQKGFDYLDFSLATDGLVAERTQGITIDVAHIYFSKGSRSYIIYDTPGHIEYTRNMVTGASNATVAIVLIDARKGVVEQTYRHFFINHLLGVNHLIIAINKMDLEGYSQEIFLKIKTQIEALSKLANDFNANLHFVPISALKGDNITTVSKNMPWFSGGTILGLLENIPLKKRKSPMRFPVQTVIRPKQDAYHDYRAYTGKIYGDTLKVGDKITVLPSKKQTTISSISANYENYETANAGDAISVCLADDVDVSRGNWLVKSDELPKEAKEITAQICWMDAPPLKVGQKFILQQGTSKVKAKIKNIEAIIATDFSGENTTIKEIAMNDIGRVQLQLAKPFFFDPYTVSKITGSFILINPNTNNTSGAGFIS